MLGIYSRIQEIEKILEHDEITSCKLEISTDTKIHLVQKLEQERVVTNTIG